MNGFAEGTSDRPVCVVSVTGDDLFAVRPEALRAVLAPVAGLPVAVVSVAGAFRTGKSFLLDIFLRFLRYHEAREHAAELQAPAPLATGSPAWLVGEGGDLLEGGAGAGAGAGAGFGWQRGDERCTTGMWMWGRAFVLPRRAPGAPAGAPSRRVAVLLMDTQGLGDSETTRRLTNAIFGLSVLLSSFQVFNLSHSLQDGHLQELALFTEYANVVNAAARDAQAEIVGGGGGNGSAGGSAAAAGAAASAAAAAAPFQRLDFLVRDANGGIEADPNDAEALEAEMAAYLERAFVAGRSTSRDLRVPREHLRQMFERLSCFKLPYPSKSVAEGRYADRRPYDGNVREISLDFRVLVERYTQRVFRELEPKKIGGREVSGRELEVFAREFCVQFQREGTFPNAQNMLDAISTVSNDNAFQAARGKFNFLMNEAAGNGRPHVDDATLRRIEADAQRAALSLFDVRANFGPRALRSEKRLALAAELVLLGEGFRSRNAERDVRFAMTPTMSAVALMLVVYALRALIDVSCSPWLGLCARISSFLALANTLVFAALAYSLVAPGDFSFDRLLDKLRGVAGASEQLRGGGGGGAAVSAGIADETAPHAALAAFAVTEPPSLPPPAAAAFDALPTPPPLAAQPAAPSARVRFAVDPADEPPELAAEIEPVPFPVADTISAGADEMMLDSPAVRQSPQRSPKLRNRGKRSEA